MNNNMSAMEIAANLRKPIGEKGLKVAELMNKGNATFYNELYKSVNWEDGMRVLEIGTGNAKHIPEILSQANDITYVGVDYSKTMVETAKNNNPNQKFYHQDLLKLDLPEDSFDLIFSINTVYFLNDLNLMAKNLKKYLSNKGEIHIGKRPKEDMEKLNEITQFNFIKYSNEEVILALMEEGLNVLKVTSIKEPEKNLANNKVSLHSDFIIANGN